MIRPESSGGWGSGPRSVDPVTDPHGRVIDYLRIAVTDRCNLRCRYCMPANGIPLLAQYLALRYDELTRLCRTFCALGVRKIRITGGEPLLRPGLASWISEIAALPTRPELLLTTNGTRLVESLDELARAGLQRINLSLDSLRSDRWTAITRRPGHAAVLHAMDAVLERGLGLKINVVVLPGINEDEIVDFVGLTRERPVTVRFIEPMPFSGDESATFVPFDGERIRSAIESAYELVPEVNAASAVDRLFAVPGHQGQVAIIEGYTRSFCGSCSRIRLDLRGRLRTCLYGEPAADLGELLRSGGDDPAIRERILAAIGRKFVDGHAAQAARTGSGSSMACIGG